MGMKHVHKFLKMPAKKTNTWTCVYCSWFVHEGLSHIVLSKEGECWSCGDVFHMTENALEEDKPRCDNCRGVAVEDITKFLKEKGIE